MTITGPSYEIIKLTDWYMGKKLHHCPVDFWIEISQSKDWCSIDRQQMSWPHLLYGMFQNLKNLSDVYVYVLVGGCDDFYCCDPSPWDHTINLHIWHVSLSIFFSSAFIHSKRFNLQHVNAPFGFGAVKSYQEINCAICTISSVHIRVRVLIHIKY